MDKDLQAAMDATRTASAMVRRMDASRGGTETKSLAEAVLNLATAVEILIEKQAPTS
jgi:hypothetical protein